MVKTSYLLYGKDGERHVLSTHLDGISGLLAFMREVLKGEGLSLQTKVSKIGRLKTTVSALGICQ